MTAANTRCAGRLAGKVALVTGAGGGLGEEMARHLAREGWRLAIADLVVLNLRYFIENA